MRPQSCSLVPLHNDGRERDRAVQRSTNIRGGSAAVPAVGRREGSPAGPRGRPLDSCNRCTEHSCSRKQTRKKESKAGGGKEHPWESKARGAEYQRFAEEVISVLPDEGALLFVTTGTPPRLPRLKQHRRFATLCSCEGCDFVSVLDWGADARDPARSPGRGDGEHQHAIVWTPDRKAFVVALHDWADRFGVDYRSLDWKTIGGWDAFFDTRATNRLRKHIARVLSYSTKAPKTDRERDIRRHAIAGGRFAEPWETFLRNATSARAPSVTKTSCLSCHTPIGAGRTLRAKYCSEGCRVRAWRERERRSKDARAKSRRSAAVRRLVRRPSSTARPAPRRW